MKCDSFTRPDVTEIALVAKVFGGTSDSRKYVCVRRLLHGAPEVKFPDVQITTYSCDILF